MYKSSTVATIGRDSFVSLALYDTFIKEKFELLSLILPASEFRSKHTVCLLSLVSTETQIKKGQHLNIREASGLSQNNVHIQL